MDERGAWGAPRWNEFDIGRADYTPTGCLLRALLLTGTGCEPFVAIALLAAHDRVELLLQRLGDRTHRPLPTLILSTERIAVTSAAVPVKNTSSAM